MPNWKEVQIEINKEILKLKNPGKAIDAVRRKYHPAFLSTCQQAISLSKSLVAEWLSKNMCKENPDAVKRNCSSIIAAHNHPSGNKQPGEGYFSCAGIPSLGITESN